VHPQKISFEADTDW
jgi:hypothetical protein